MQIWAVFELDVEMGKSFMKEVWKLALRVVAVA